MWAATGGEGAAYQADHSIGLAGGGRLEAGAVVEEDANNFDIAVLDGEAEGPRLAAVGAAGGSDGRSVWVGLALDEEADKLIVLQGRRREKVEEGERRWGKARRKQTRS